MPRSLTILVLTTLLTLCAGHAAGQMPEWSARSGLGAVGGDDFLPVEQAYRLSVKTTDGGLQLRWQISDGYYLYRHGFKAHRDGEDLTPTLDMPPGQPREDELFGEVEVYYDQLDIDLPLTETTPFQLQVQSQGCADAGLCYPPRVQLFAVDPARASAEEVFEPAAAATSAGKAPGGAGTASTTGLLSAALLAFLGGLILNLMPCVLPVLALKVLGLANGEDDARHRRRHGWWYTAGVALSFCLIAALLIALKTAGGAVGWGFQLQSPWFVGALVYLFFTMALLLAGAADFSGSWMGFGQSLANGGGYRGSFFTGALAVLVASPCTAPFMGVAMGFALTQHPITALLIFACLGAGMAAPFLLLSYLPGLGQWLPKPGPWMVRFREFLAFPLLATGVWLLWVIGQQAGPTAVALVLSGCLIIALALWFNGNDGPVRALRAALFAAALALLANSQLEPTARGAGDHDRYSPARLAALRSEGRPVFVNFTADWCITCLANENWVLGRQEVQEAFARHQVSYLTADWTNQDPEIAATLEAFGRSGIPLYLLYPPGDGAPEVLPQILSVDLVLELLSAIGPGQERTANL